MITIGVSMKDWNIFTHRWPAFKDGCGIVETSASVQIFHCGSRELADSLLKSDTNIVTQPFAALLTAMQRLTIIPIATSVRRSELMQMRQLQDETFRPFAARVRRKADTCTFSANCSFGEVNYTDHMIRDTLLNGIADTEIRREMLGTADILTKAKNNVIALVENKEMARNATHSADVSAMSEFQRVRNFALGKDRRNSARKHFTSAFSDHSS